MKNLIKTLIFTIEEFAIFLILWWAFTIIVLEFVGFVALNHSVSLQNLLINGYPIFIFGILGVPFSFVSIFILNLIIWKN